MPFLLPEISVSERVFSSKWESVQHCQKHLWQGWAINLARRPPWEGRYQWRAITSGNRNKCQFKLSLGTNVCCVDLERILDLKIFVNASAGHCKSCGGPLLARRPLFAYPWSMITKDADYFVKMQKNFAFYMTILNCWDGTIEYWQMGWGVSFHIPMPVLQLQ